MLDHIYHFTNSARDMANEQKLFTFVSIPLVNMKTEFDKIISLHINCSKDSNSNKAVNKEAGDSPISIKPANGATKGISTKPTWLRITEIYFQKLKETQKRERKKDIPVISSNWGKLWVGAHPDKLSIQALL